MDYCACCHYRMNRRKCRVHSSCQTIRKRHHCNHPSPLCTKLPENIDRICSDRLSAVCSTQILYKSIGTDSSTPRHSERDFDFPILEGGHLFRPNGTLLTFQRRCNSHIIGTCDAIWNSTFYISIVSHLSHWKFHRFPFVVVNVKFRTSHSTSNVSKMPTTKRVFCCCCRDMCASK